MTTEYVDGNAPMPDPNEQITDLVLQLTETQDRCERLSNLNAALTTKIESMQGALDAAAGGRRLVEADLRIVADMLREEAISRDWCGDYGTFVDQVNARTSLPWLEHCMEDRILTVSVTFSYACKHGFAEECTEGITGSIRSFSSYDMPDGAHIDDIDVTVTANSVA